MSRPHRGPGPIPNRWLYCPRNADSFIADKFLAFKTPLSNRFQSQMPPKCIFPPELVFSFAKMKKARIGLWIDLTNTSRFYDRKSIEDNNAQYLKMSCRGHGETPSKDQTQSFIEIVDEFIQTNPLDIIGVHCTHGFNRTGFLIVSYMVERMDCSVEAAILAFAKARPPGIYKEDYIKELFRRYEDEEDAIPAPALPDWCFEYNEREETNHNELEPMDAESRKRKLHDTPNDEQEQEQQQQQNDGDEGDGGEQVAEEENGEAASGSNPPAKKKRKERFNKNATFMADVPGVQLVMDRERLTELQEKVQKMCKWKGNGFPGCQPVSMDLNNIAFLGQKEYRVSWKADGTRYMMLIEDKDEIFFFDRDYACFQVTGLTFYVMNDLSRHLKNTLLDGEMVIDHFQGRKIPRFLVYDIIKYNGEDVEKGDEEKTTFYDNRLRCIRKGVIEPRHEAMRRGLIHREREPFSMRLKEFYEITKSYSLLSPKFARTLCHEPDGLIFQPADAEYVSGPFDQVLKWKPIHMNSVDFLLQVGEESGVGILQKKIGYLYVGQKDEPFASIKYSKSLKDLNGKIIECKFDKQQHGWVFMRERKDKSYPNSYNTAMAVCNSILYPVTTEILLDFIKMNRFKSRRERESEMMPPPSNLPNNNH